MVGEDNGKFAFSEKDQKRVWKEHMEKRMNKENAWDQKTEIGIGEGSVKEVYLDLKFLNFFSCIPFWH